MSAAQRAFERGSLPLPLTPFARPRHAQASDNFSEAVLGRKKVAIKAANGCPSRGNPARQVCGGKAAKLLQPTLTKAAIKDKQRVQREIVDACAGASRGPVMHIIDNPKVMVPDSGKLITHYPPPQAYCPCHGAPAPCHHSSHQHSPHRHAIQAAPPMVFSPAPYHAFHAVGPPALLIAHHPYYSHPPPLRASPPPLTSHHHHHHHHHQPQRHEGARMVWGTARGLPLGVTAHSSATPVRSAFDERTAACG